MLLATKHDLTAGTTWAEAGYTVAHFLSQAAQQDLQTGLAKLMRQAMRAAGLFVSTDFPVARYHQVVGDNQQLHLAIVNLRKEYPIDLLPVPASLPNAIEESKGRFRVCFKQGRVASCNVLPRTLGERKITRNGKKY